MSGVLDTFRTRIPALAAEVGTQLALRAELRGSVQAAYFAGLADLDEATSNGSLLSGEILARWQDFAGTGDLLRTLQVRKGRVSGGRAKKRAVPARAKALKAAIQSGLDSLVASLADRAAENAVSSWQSHQAGAALLAGLAEAGPQRTSAEGIAALARSSPDLARSERAISAWQDHVLQLVRAENVTRRSIARVVSFDDEALALVLTIGVLGFGAGEATVSEGASAAPQRLLTSLFGAGLLRDIGARVRMDLHKRISLLFDEEMQRFAVIIDSAGIPDDLAETQLQQASYAVEAAR
jgi:hypothetical protein